jgi:SpoVK/Ycf46/Vps4 family AAA+-type ATPase
MIDQDESHRLILAAANHPEIFDHVLFRRFFRSMPIPQKRCEAGF